MLLDGVDVDGEGDGGSDLLCDAEEGSGGVLWGFFLSFRTKEETNFCNVGLLYGSVMGVSGRLSDVSKSDPQLMSAGLRLARRLTPAASSSEVCAVVFDRVSSSTLDGDGRSIKVLLPVALPLPFPLPFPLPPPLAIVRETQA